MPCSCFCSSMSFINLWKSCSLLNREAACLAGLMAMMLMFVNSWLILFPLILSLPVPISTDWDRSTRLFLSMGEDRDLCIPRQLWLVLSKGRRRCVNRVMGSGGRPGPVHHLSAYVQSARQQFQYSVSHRRAAGSKCVKICATTSFFSLYQNP